MKFNQLKIFVVLLFIIAGSSLLFNGCKKQDSQDKRPLKNINAVMNEKLKNALASQNFSYEIPLNIPLKANLLDENGNRYQRPKSARKYVTEDSPLGCGFSNDNFDQNVSSVLRSIKVLYQCGQGYQITARIRVTCPIDNLSDFSPTRIYPTASSAIKSRGTLQLLDLSNNIISSNTNIQPLAFVQKVGADSDPNSPYNNIFDIEFTSPWLSQTVIGQSFGFKTGLIAYTNCPDLPFVNIDNGSSPVVSLNFNAPCERIDDIYINPDTYFACTDLSGNYLNPQPAPGDCGLPNSGTRSGEFGTLLGIGANFSCSNPSGYQYPAKQIIQYKISSNPGNPQLDDFSSGYTQQVINPTDPGIALTNIPDKNNTVWYTFRYTNGQSNGQPCKSPAIWLYKQFKF